MGIGKAAGIIILRLLQDTGGHLGEIAHISGRNLQFPVNAAGFFLYQGLQLFLYLVFHKIPHKVRDAVSYLLSRFLRGVPYHIQPCEQHQTRQQEGNHADGQQQQKKLIADVVIHLFHSFNFFDYSCFHGLSSKPHNAITSLWKHRCSKFMHCL